jgi:HEPN domain-containing protein
MRAETFERDRGITGTLAAEADTDGIVVYGSPKGSPSMRPADPCARWEAVERWLAVVEVDRNTAATCIATGKALHGSAAFHCQQAIEKLLKGFLVLASKRFRKTLSLAQLGAAAQQSFPDLGNLVRAARNWSDWAFEYRYPSASGPAEPLPERRRAAAGPGDGRHPRGAAASSPTRRLKNPLSTGVLRGYAQASAEARRRGTHCRGPLLGKQSRLDEE